MKLTRKEISNKYRVISVGYCQLQNLLQYSKRLGYTTSQAYGWRSDNYLFTNDLDCSTVVISTGYNPVNGVKVDRVITNKYDDLAREVTLSPLPYEERKNKLDQLIQEFINEVIK